MAEQPTEFEYQLLEGDVLEKKFDAIMSHVSVVAADVATFVEELLPHLQALHPEAQIPEAPIIRHIMDDFSGAVGCEVLDKIRPSWRERVHDLAERVVASVVASEMFDHQGNAPSSKRSN